MTPIQTRSLAALFRLLVKNSCRRGRTPKALCSALFVTGFLWVGLASAANDRTDYDIDNNGLIDIVDVTDLNEVRNHPDGTTIYSETPASVGCPSSAGGSSVCSSGGCCGFELMNDVNLDDNGNGFFGQDDEVWVDPYGWLPIAVFGNGNPADPVIFEGNGFAIRSVFVDNYSNPVGLFGELNGALVQNLTVSTQTQLTAPAGLGTGTGVLAGVAVNSTIIGSAGEGRIRGGGNDYTMGGLIGVCLQSVVEESYAAADIIGGGQLGGLVATADNCFIRKSFATSRVESNYHRTFVDGGGLVGRMMGGAISACFATGNVVSISPGGGLVGTADGVIIQASFATGKLVGPLEEPVGGLVGDSNTNATDSYWATDLSGISASSTGAGYTVQELQCPQSAGSGFPCVGGLYSNWGNYLNLDGDEVWNFGDSGQLPGLNIQGTTFRDSDGDGTIDRDDAFPNEYAAAIDFDGDLAHDKWKEGCDQACRDASGLTLDNLTLSPAAAIDLDLDGMPGAWNPGCNFACQQASGLQVDPSPLDYDNDGIPDSMDTDDNNFNGTDPDADSDGLIDIETVAELEAMRLSLGGETQYDISTGFNSPAGCPPRLVDGTLQRRCRGYELLNDLDLSGVAWERVGTNADDPGVAFFGDFDGNGHVIYNLQLTSQTPIQGLFGAVRDGTIRRLGLSGSLMHVHAEGGIVGALAGYAQREVIEEVFSTGEVSSGSDLTGGDTLGGLIGIARKVSIFASFTTGPVGTVGDCTDCRAGGLVGTAAESLIESSFASGVVSAPGSSTGGFIGDAGQGTLIRGSYSMGFVDNGTIGGGFAGLAAHNTESCYWARDTSGQVFSAGLPTNALLSELACPTGDNNTSCVPGVTLYTDWDDYTDTNGDPYWRFGNSSSLPGLCLGGVLYRPDSAGDLAEPGDCSSGGFQFQLISNTDFESGSGGWVGAYGATISSSTLQAHTGSRSLRASNRNAGSYQGAEYNLLGTAIAGETLDANLWTRVAGDPSEPVLFTLRSRCQGGQTVFHNIAAGTATNTGWTELAGSVVVPSCNLAELAVYAEGPRTGVVLYVDDVSLTRTVEGTPLAGSFVVTNDWGTGYCADLVVTNSTSQATSTWSATFDLNGTSIAQIWNLGNSGTSGNITVYPLESWSEVIPPGGSSHSLGFCADRPAGSSALPGAPTVTGVF